MSGWNFDMSIAPKGRWEDKTRKMGSKEVTKKVFVAEKVDVAAAQENLVTVFYWVPKIDKAGNDTGEGRWNMFTKEHPPIAWRRRPEHPNFSGSDDGQVS